MFEKGSPMASTEIIETITTSKISNGKLLARRMKWVKSKNAAKSQYPSNQALVEVIDLHFEHLVEKFEFLMFESV
jgi:hypothetical protein